MPCQNTRSQFQRTLPALRLEREVRWRKVRRIRAQIRSGKYQNDLKMSVAVDRLLDWLWGPRG